MWTEKLADIQAGFRKDRGTRDQIADIHRIIEEVREFQKNIYFCFIGFYIASSTSASFDCVDYNKLWKILQEMEIPDHLTCLLRNLYARQETAVEPGIKQQIGSKLVKECVKAVYWYSVYLTYMQSTSYEMLGEDSRESLGQQETPTSQM